MKKELVFVLFVLFPFLLFSQKYEHNRPGIGINLGFEGYNGLIIGTEFSYPIARSLFINGRLRSPASSIFGDDLQEKYNYYDKPINYYVSSIGLGYLKRISNKVDFSFGLQYQYKYYWSSPEYLHLKNEKSIIFPFDIIFHINKKFSIKTGFSPTFNLNNSRRRFRFCVDPHLTFNLKF